jgi:glycosyltransferase involved in cell wall biosynthesis
MPSTPTFTVWTAVYNEAEQLQRCIESITNQSVRPLEYLILDDASTDNTLEVAEHYARQHPWIRVVPNDINRGAYANFNRIFSLAKGEFLYDIGADDYSCPNTLEHFQNALSRWPDASIVSGMMALDDATGKTIRIEKIEGISEPKFLAPEEYLVDYLLKHPANHSLGPSSAYRKSAVEQVGGHREELKHWSDSFIHRSIALESGMVYVPEILHSFTMSEGSLSQKACDHNTFNETLHNTVTLMRSPMFAERFPEQYVDYWETGYRQIMYQTVLDQWHTMTTDRNLFLYSTLDNPSVSNKCIGALASWMQRIENAFILPKIKEYAARYRQK